MARVLALMAPKASIAPGAPASMSVAASVGTFMRIVGLADLAEHLLPQCAQDWPAPRQRFHIVDRRNRVAGIEPPGEVDGIVFRSLTHPLRMDGGTLHA